MSQSRQHKNFDQPVHNLRAIAIILVVYAHCAAFLPDSRILYITPDEKNLYRNIFRLFSGGTYIFAFISGYLSYALFRNTPYIEFIVKKIKHILFPYLFFSLSLLTVSYATLRFFGVHWHAVRQFDSWNAVAKALLTGGVQGHYWYMPFTQNPLHRLCLHAFRLFLYHPVTGERMEFETPYPADFVKLFE